MNINVLGKAFKFNVCFRDVTLTAHAGVVLMRDFVSKLGVPDVIDAEVAVKERERGYPESEHIMSLCWNAILGGDCLRDLNVLRGDAGVAELIGVESILAPTTAGEFLRQFQMGDLADLRRVQRRVAERVRPLQTRNRVTLDLDASLYEQGSERKQGSRMHYQGQVGYYPLFVFWAEEREMVATHLRRGNAHAAPVAVWFLEQALETVPEGQPLFLRADSEFYSWDLIDFCESHQPRPITYAITADQSQSLKRAIASLPETAWRRYDGDEQVAEVWFAPHGHDAHRYIIKRHRVVDKDGTLSWRSHVIITNDHRRSPKKLMNWALGRCAMENLIKEHKNDFGFEKMPSQKFHANWAWLLISQLAWNLVAWFNRLCLPKECHTLTLGTLRHRLFNVAGKIVHQARQRFLVLSDDNWFQDWWAFALKQLAGLSSISP